MRNFDAEGVHFEDGEPVGALFQVRAEDEAHARQVVAMVAEDEGLVGFELEDVWEVAA